MPIEQRTKVDVFQVDLICEKNKFHGALARAGVSRGGPTYICTVCGFKVGADEPLYPRIEYVDAE